MLHKVCFLTNDNLYNSKRHFTQSLSQSLEGLGVETRIIDLEEKSLGTAEIQMIHDWSPDFTCSFSSIDPLLDESFFWDTLKIPHLYILVDPAIFNLQYIKSPYAAISCTDKFDCEFLKRAKFDRTFFMPHAVDKKYLEEPLNEDRPYDVVLVGSCYDHQQLREAWKKHLSTQECDILEEAIDCHLSESHTHFTEALLKAINHSNVDPSKLNMIELAVYLDHYTRGKDRVELVRAIKDAHVHLFGHLFWDEEMRKGDWNHYFGDQVNVTIHEGVPYEETFDIYKKSKIALNSTPFFRNGSHERVFNCLAMGCSVITSENRFLRDQFSTGKGVKYYLSNDRAQVNESINAWLDNEELRKKEMLEGRSLVKDHHTWDHRAWQLLDMMPKLTQKITYFELQ